MIVIPCQIPFEGRMVTSVEIDHACYSILESIAQAQGQTLLHQLRRILAEGMLPGFSDAIRLHFRAEDDEENENA
jgi:predicted DNA-binding ribbon-helix-helix protein